MFVSSTYTEPTSVYIMRVNYELRQLVIVDMKKKKKKEKEREREKKKKRTMSSVE